MSIFTRREIQKRLDSLSDIIGPKKLERLVRDLNIEGNPSNSKRHLESLAKAWEVVVVSAFVEAGHTEYEKKISNGKRPDVFFHDGDMTLMADVLAISDEEQHRKNPVDDFSSILVKMWRDSGPKKGGLSWSVEGVDLELRVDPAEKRSRLGPLHVGSGFRPVSRHAVKRLALPPADRLSEYLYEKVWPFFLRLRTPLNKPIRLDINEQYNQTITVRFSLVYDPQGHGFVGGHPSYTTITDMESHVLWRRLLDKSDQLSLAEEEVPRLLFVCDGGCDALHRPAVGGGSRYRCEELLNHFWRRPVLTEAQRWSWIVEKGISGAIVLPIEPANTMPRFPHQRDFVLKPTLYLNPYSSFPVDKTTVALLKSILSTLPRPVESPRNVIRAIRANHNPARRLGGLTMSDNSITMSGVELLRILSGELTLEEFCKNYNLSLNPFKNALVKSRSIKSIRVEPALDRDDDKIVIEFGSHDAALGPFRLPKDPGTPYSIRGRKK